jgi:hypothetical protein
MHPSFCAGFAVVMLIGPTHCWAGTVVGEKTQGYQVKYQDGAVENYVATYTASLNDNMSESGHPSIPLKGWLTDTRQCHWQISSEVVRDLCIVSRSGQQYCQGAFNKVFSQIKNGKGNDLVLLNLAPEDCGDAGPRHASDVNDVTHQLMEALPAVANQDSQSLVNDIRAVQRSIHPGGQV